MPNWTHDELVLAADLVSKNAWTGVRSTSPAAQALSELLKRGQLHPGIILPANFRSPASIQRKTFDLATADAAYHGKPTRGGMLVGPVIQAFRDDLVGMQARAGAIRAALLAGEVGPADTHDDELGHEGGILEHIARTRERDRSLRDRKLAEVRAQGRSIICEACNFDFRAFYGERGDGYIEVHHVLPLHVSGPTKTSLEDLALLCANCHRMCHRGPWITPLAVRELVQQHR
ncbi:HNH endonuclease [Ruicaihuangia caeni]|uniref:HNH endonuclease n=1 Tax=Ruicaihuangia caeni TaxID=3042517 RepID=UPI00338FA675